MPTATATRKRKQTDDMPDPSPPKRVTRARAAKTIEEPAKTTKATKSAGKKTTKITTASALAAAAPRAEPLKATRTATKRKTSVDEPSEVAESIVVEQPEEAPKVVRARGRPKKEAAAEPAAPKTKARQTKAPVQTAAPPKTTRTTKAKQKPEQEGGASTEDTVSKAAPAKKSTRGRPAAASTNAEAALGKKPATRKKVTFDGGPEDDKENAPVPVDPKKKQVAKATGLRAKPVRTPAAAPATRSTRGRKATTAKVDEVVNTKSQPLSPKKATQVAKSSSDSEDELAGASPVKALSKSPIKVPMSIRSPAKSASHNDTQTSLSSASPVKFSGASVLDSPAKRPPPSPFKESLNQSPKRVALPASPNKPQLNVSVQSPFKDALKASPKRINFTGPIPPIQFAASSQSSFKQSLLQSPARRPASTLNSGVFASPTKAHQHESIIVSPAKVKDSFKLPTITPRKTVLSPSKGAESPEQSIKAHSMTPAEQADLRSREPSPSPARQSSARLDAEDLMESTDQSKSPEESIAEPASIAFPSYRSPASGFDSEDELQSGPSTLHSPSRARNVAVRDFAFDTPTSGAFGDIKDFNSSRRQSVKPLAMTPLALQLSTWCASSPEKTVSTSQNAVQQGISTPSGPTLFAASEQVASRTEPSPARVSHFDEQMFGHEQEPLTVLEDQDLHQDERHHDENEQDGDAMDVDMTDAPEASIDESQASEQYGDENAAPIDPLIVFAPVAHEHPQMRTEETEDVVHTPEQAPQLRNREIHTVSKVPLRPSDDGESPIKIPRKRSKSTSAPLNDISGDLRSLLPRNNSVVTYSLASVSEHITEQTTPGRKVSYETLAINQLMTPVKGGAFAQISPIKTVRKGADAEILRGAVIYVDVHTSEGADASGIFIELLTAMGAKCIKQWTWNPRASAAADQSNTPNCKIGITHVVYKDGGRRTLQKVREAKGLVLCVGVGWVLE